jgi:NADPH:quinone reductase
MRAIQARGFGGPDVLHLVDMPVPEPAEGDVLMRVTRAGVNFADTHQRRNEYLAKAELPLIPGAEVAGVREDTGERVVAMCVTGGYAEYAAAPEALTVPHRHAGAPDHRQAAARPGRRLRRNFRLATGV